MYGHFERDCGLKASNNNKSVNYVQEGDDPSPNNLFLFYGRTKNNIKGVQYLYLGKIFSTMDESFKSKIKLGDDSKTLEVYAKRAMEFHTKDGMKSDVHYTPQLKHNFLSVGKLCEQNHKVVFENRQCTICDENKGNRLAIVVSMSKNQMFSLKFGEYSINHANMAYEDITWLWHLRRGI